jgi:hypothetical protein
MGSVKLTLLMAQVCHAMDSELTENYHLRIGCREDCRERGHAFSPRLGRPPRNEFSLRRTTPCPNTLRTLGPKFSMLVSAVSE